MTNRLLKIIAEKIKMEDEKKNGKTEKKGGAKECQQSSQTPDGKGKTL